MLKIYSIIISLLCFANLSAQDPIRYTTKQGLPSNHIYDVAQDSNGIMWFATNRGVVKYDGIKFKTFTVKDGLPNNDTWMLASDFQGRIWYFSKSKYQGYIQNDSIYKFMVPDSMVISPMHISKSIDRIWMYSWKGNFLSIEDNTLKIMASQDFIEFSNFFRKQEGLSKLKRLDYIRMFNPELLQYIIITKNELLMVDFDFNILYQRKHDVPKINDYSRYNYGSMPNQTYYLTTDEGILFINHKNISSKFFSFKELIGHKTEKATFCKALLNEIQLSVSGHLLRFNYDFELIEKKSFSKTIPNHRSYKDRAGNIWLIDTGKGITFLPNTQLQTNYYLKEKNIQKIGKINQSLFVGISNDGFYDYIPRKDSFIKKTTQTPDIIYQIKYNQDTQEGFLVSDKLTLTHRNNTLSPVLFGMLNGYYNKSSNGIKYLINFNNFLYALTADNIYKRKLQTHTETKILGKQGLILAEVHNNSLFIGATDGLHILEKDSLVKPNIKNELLNTSILDLLSTKDHLLVGTDGRGLYLYTNKEIIHLKNTDDLSIQKIIKKENALWLATQKGVFKILLDTTNLSDSKIIDAFYAEDGLLENNTNDIYCEDNILYAASDMGLAKLDINNAVYQKKPNLYFNTIKDTLEFEGGKSNNIPISFSVLDYVNQENYSYAYRLLPNQEQWLPTTTKTINFSNLAPNLYTLEVRATDQHGNQCIENQYITIIPAWWQTLWAKLGFFLLGAIFLGTLLKFFQLQIKKREHKKAQQEQRISGLELQAIRSQMNPHFVHNSLNAIQYYIQRNEIDLSEKYLVKFSKLIRLFFNYSRKQNIAIIDEVGLLNNYLQIEQLRFEDKLDYKIQVDEKIDQEEQLIPSMILQPIVENAVNHGLFHKQGKGTVLIDFIYINDISFKVMVKDDGIGINKAKAIFKKSSKNYQSRSSAVLQERLALLKQSNDWDISYQIEDLSINNNATGTLVMLIFNQI